MYPFIHQEYIRIHFYNVSEIIFFQLGIGLENHKEYFAGRFRMKRRAEVFRNPLHYILWSKRIAALLPVFSKFQLCWDVYEGSRDRNIVLHLALIDRIRGSHTQPFYHFFLNKKYICMFVDDTSKYPSLSTDGIHL